MFKYYSGFTVTTHTVDIIHMLRNHDLGFANFHQDKPEYAMIRMSFSFFRPAAKSKTKLRRVCFIFNKSGKSKEGGGLIAL